MDFLAQALAGDELAWDILFARLWPVVAGVAAATAKTAAADALVEDIAQDVFVHLTQDDARRLRGFDPTRGSLESYVARIARNRSIDFLRRHRRHRNTIDISALPEVAAHDDDPLPMVESWEMVAALATLSEREREAVHLLFKLDLSVAETATRMNVSAETVRSVKSHALRKLRRFFSSTVRRAEP